MIEQVQQGCLSHKTLEKTSCRNICQIIVVYFSITSGTKLN